MAAISLTKARKMIATIFRTGAEMGLKPLSVIVLDAGGNIKAFERQDGASPGRFQIAEGKAYGSVMLGIGGTAQNARADAQAYFIASVNGAFGGKVIPVPGGVLVKTAKGEILGAIGVTGDTSENDLTAALAGIEAVNLVGEG